MTELLKMFCDFVTSTIDEEGVYPLPAMWRERDGEKVVVNAMAVDAPTVLDHVWQQIACEQVTELIFGLDRSTKPNQGTEFADVLTCAHWHPDFHESWNAAWRPFVINYQHEPRIVRPPDFDNEFWNAKIREELQSFCPPIRIKVSQS